MLKRNHPLESLRELVESAYREPGRTGGNKPDRKKGAAIYDNPHDPNHKEYMKIARKASMEALTKYDSLATRPDRVGYTTLDDLRMQAMSVLAGGGTEREAIKAVMELAEYLDMWEKKIAARKPGEKVSGDYKPPYV